MNIGVIGLGLIGGSMALECKARGHRVYGYDQNKSHAEKAQGMKLIDEIANLDSIVVKSQVIILAIPVDFIETLALRILNNIPENTVVIDVGSTKKSICNSIRTHTKRSRFVAAHPLSGTEFSGPLAAHLDLFKGKKNIICEEHLSDEDALDTALELFTDFGMQNLFMDPDSHDRHMAYVSHLSHVSSFTLSKTVLEIEHDEKQIFNLASTGFESTVRLAKSSPDTWSSIFLKNREHLSTALGEYIQHLKDFKEIIDNNDKEASHKLMSEANEIKRVLKGKKFNVVKLS